MWERPARSYTAACIRSSDGCRESRQNISFTWTHMLRMPLSVKSRFRKRPAGVPLTLDLGHLNELRMIERVQRFPAKLKAPCLAKRNGLGEVQIEVVRARRSVAYCGQPWTSSGTQSPRPSVRRRGSRTSRCRDSDIRVAHRGKTIALAA